MPRKAGAASKDAVLDITIPGKGGSEWKVGSLLGAGACGKVYELVPILRGNAVAAANVSSKKWVVKVCPIATGTGKSQEKKIAIATANSLFWEGMLYQNRLQTLQGSILPKLPVCFDTKEPLPRSPAGDIDGFKYLVMERMQEPLWSIVSHLVPPKRATSTTKIPLGNVAGRLITIAETFHEQQFLMIDVKPENFMLAYGGNNDDFASRMRFLDLGLVEPYQGQGGHRPDANSGGGNIVGTPLYASLNVHQGHTHSRRDDLEAIGYIVAELVIRLVAALNSTTNEYEKGNNATYLPWSTGTSDQAIGKLKEENALPIESSFYKRMGHGPASQLIHQYLTTVHSIEYKAKPDYQALRKLLAPLAVESSAKHSQRSPPRPSARRVVAPTPESAAALASVLEPPLDTSTKPAATREVNGGRTRTSPRRFVAPEPPRFVAPEPPSVAALPSQAAPVIAPATKPTKPEGARTRSVRKHELQDDFQYDEDAPRRKKVVLKADKSLPVVPPHTMVIDDEEPSPAETVEHIEDVENMDVDFSTEETTKSNTKNKKPSSEKVELFVKTGPRKGERLVLKINEILTIGSAASNSRNRMESFPGDTEMAAQHAKLKLSFRFGFPRVEVTTLKSSTTTRVNGASVLPGKSVVAFDGFDITAGTTTLVVRRTSS